MLGTLAGLVLGISGPQLYARLAMGMLSCADRHQSEACEANYTRTAAAEAGVAVGLTSTIAALWLAHRARKEDSARIG